MRPQQQPLDLLRAFDHTSDAVFAVDDRMRIVFWNRAAERVFRLAAEGVIGARCDEVVAGFETSGAALCMPDCRVINCARRGYAAETYDLRRQDIDSKAQWLNVTNIVLRGRTRASTLAVHIVRDVTDRRRIEDQASQVLVALGGVDAPASTGLTKREADVIRLLACGLSNAGIAGTLGISTTTVRNHIEHVLAKFGVHSKLEAVVYAAQHGLV